MNDRKEGWYWVRHTSSDLWEVAHFCGGFFLGIIALDFSENDENYVIGPRIPTPDEPWQCVPVEPTREMRQAIIEKTGSIQFMADTWAAWPDMLAAAPKPGEEQ